MVVLPNGQPFQDAYPVAAYDGVKTDGVVVAGNWHTNPGGGQIHVFLYTGADPEPYGYFTLAIPQTVIPAGKRSLCQLTAAWTNPDYAFGYALPYWPWHSLQQIEYNIVDMTVSFRWDAVLAPLSSYSINVFCPLKM